MRIQVLRRAVLTVAIALFVQAVAMADANDADPPGRVGRLNYSQGAVSVQPAGEQDWVTAEANRPLITGDNLWADRDSRAELHIGSSAIRLNAETSVTFLAVNDRSVQLRLALGSLIVRVRHIDDEDSFEVDTPNLAFSLLRNGEYRIDVNAEGNETITTVLQGRGEVIGGGQQYSILAGQHVRFTGTDALDFDIEQIPAHDGFENWALQRDQREDSSESANYVSREMTGYEDLDENGHWRYVAGYGPVWTPAAVPADWAPYRYGHWVWVAPWGWTWVDDAPWGFAPFHYGRWVFAGGWAWVPGPVVVRPVYAPALVAFVGGGGFHFSVSIGGGPGVAWFPLAPGEVYVPTYRASRVYVTNVNVTNTVVNVTRVTTVYNYYTTNSGPRVNQLTYVNQRVPNGVSVVSHDTFVNARPVARNLAPVPAQELQGAPVTRMAPVTPVRTSVFGAGAPTRALPPAAVINRPVLAKRLVPSPVRPSMAPVNRSASMNAAPPNGQNPRQVPRPSPSTRNASPPATPQALRPAQTTESSRPQATAPNDRRGPAPPSALVKQAPPVQPKNSQQLASEESKFNRWQQQRDSAAQRPVQQQRQPESRQAPHEDRSSRPAPAGR